MLMQMIKRDNSVMINDIVKHIVRNKEQHAYSIANNLFNKNTPYYNNLMICSTFLLKKYFGSKRCENEWSLWDTTITVSNQKRRCFLSAKLRNPKQAEN